MKYLFQTEALGGWLKQSNPHKRHLQTEIQGEGESRVRVPLNEIRESDLEFDSATQTLRIVGDEIAVVPRSGRPVRVPQVATRRGFRMALRRAGIDLGAIRAHVQSIANEEKREDALIEIEDTQRFKRDSELVAFIATKFSKTDAEMDAIFVQARKLDK